MPFKSTIRIPSEVLEDAIVSLAEHTAAAAQSATATERPAGAVRP